MTPDKKQRHTASFAFISFILILVNQFSGIRDAQPVNYWIATSIVIAVLLLITKPTISSFRNEPRLTYYLLLPLLLFAVYIPLSSGLGTAEIKAGLKYGVIAALIYAVYRSELTLSHFLALVSLTLLIQGGLFFLALTDWAILPLNSHGNRQGLSIAIHGTIWRLAGLTFPFFVYQALKSTKPTYFLVFLLLALVAGAVNVLDGTRTGFLILVLGGVVGAGLTVWRGKHRPQVIIGAVLAAIILFGLLYLTSNTFGNRAAGVFSQTIQLLGSGDTFSLERLDGNRQRQMETALGTISEMPFQGKGWLANLSVDGYVIHNVFLQTWADLGLLGIVLYIAIFTPAFMMARQWLKNGSGHDFMVLPLSIVFCYLFSNLFHPISTELTEWVLVAFSLGLMIRQLAAKKDN